MKRETWKKGQQDTYLTADFRKAQGDSIKVLDKAEITNRLELMESIIRLARSTRNEQFIIRNIQNSLGAVQSKLNSSIDSLIMANPEEAVALDSEVKAIRKEQDLVSTIIELSNKIDEPLETEEIDLSDIANKSLEIEDSEKKQANPNSGINFNKDYLELITECENYEEYLLNLTPEKEADSGHQKDGKTNRETWKKKQKDIYPSFHDSLKSEDNNLLKS